MKRSTFILSSAAALATTAVPIPAVALNPSVAWTTKLSSSVLTVEALENAYRMLSHKLDINGDPVYAY